MSSREEDSGNPEQRLPKLEGAKITYMLAEEVERNRGHHTSNLPDNANDTEESEYSWSKEEFE